MKRGMARSAWFLLACAGFVVQAAAQDANGEGERVEREEAAMREVLPHVRVDRERKIVEFDGVVPIDAHIEGAPNLYLEVMVCVPDTREHESLVQSKATAAHVHAALLMTGLEPGKPGAWVWEEREVGTTPPEGPAVEVHFIWTDGEGNERVDLASDWVISATSGTRLTDAASKERPRWVFAGSKMVSRGGREWYAAEAEGTVVGLHTFGTETVAWTSVMTPSADLLEPEWIPDPERVPRRGTAVVVRISAVEEPAEAEPE